jgi:hypothetical protein
MCHRKNDKFANAIRVSSSREPCYRCSPVVSHNVGSVDTERVDNADHIRDRILQGIRGHSLRAVGAPEATQVRSDDAEALRDEEGNLVAPKKSPATHVAIEPAYRCKTVVAADY